MNIHSDLQNHIGNHSVNDLYTIFPGCDKMLCFCCCSFCRVTKSVQFFVTLYTTAHQTSMSFTISRSLFKFTSTESVMPSNHFILHCPLLLLPSIFPSIRVSWPFSKAWIRILPFLHPFTQAWMYHYK